MCVDMWGDMRSSAAGHFKLTCGFHFTDTRSAFEVYAGIGLCSHDKVHPRLLFTPTLPSHPLLNGGAASACPRLPLFKPMLLLSLSAAAAAGAEGGAEGPPCCLLARASPSLL